MVITIIVPSMDSVVSIGISEYLYIIVFRVINKNVKIIIQKSQFLGDYSLRSSSMDSVISAFVVSMAITVLV